MIRLNKAITHNHVQRYRNMLLKCEVTIYFNSVWSNYRPADRLWPVDRIFMARGLSQYRFYVVCMLQ